MASQIAPVLAGPIPIKGVLYQEAGLYDPTNHIASVTTTGGTDYADVRGFSRHSIYVSNGSANSVIFTIQGGLDGTNFETISYRLLTSGSYAESNITVTAGSKDVVHLSPTEYFRYIRVNVGTANANGTKFTLYSET